MHLDHETLIHYLATLLSIFLRRWDRSFPTDEILGGRGEVEGTREEDDPRGEEEAAIRVRG